MAATRSTVPIGTAVSIASWEPLAAAKACTATGRLRTDRLRNERYPATPTQRRNEYGLNRQLGALLRSQSPCRAPHGSKQVLHNTRRHPAVLLIVGECRTDQLAQDEYAGTLNAGSAEVKGAGICSSQRAADEHWEGLSVQHNKAVGRRERSPRPLCWHSTAARAPLSCRCSCPSRSQCHWHTPASVLQHQGDVSVLAAEIREH